MMTPAEALIKAAEIIDAGNRAMWDAICALPHDHPAGMAMSEHLSMYGSFVRNLYVTAERAKADSEMLELVRDAIARAKGE